MNYRQLISQERLRQGLSLGQLSKLSGVPKTTIYHHEQGVNPSLVSADKILKALGISLKIGKESEE